MKVAIISREFPPLTHVGGIGTYAAAAAKLLADHGHEVHVICNGPITERHSVEGVQVHRVAMLNHHFPASRIYYPYRAWYRARLPHYLDAMTWARTAADYVGRNPDFNAFDVCEYPETMGEGALLTWNPESENRPRLVCRIHSGWTDDSGSNSQERRLLLSLQQKACERADILVSPSAYMAGHYTREILRVRKPVKISRNPAVLWNQPIDWTAKSAEHLLYVGRIEHRKGLQILLDALEIMGSESEGLTLRVVGEMHPSKRESDLRSMDQFRHCLETHASGKNGFRLEYAGPCGHADLYHHFDWAGISIIPSLMENYPYVALEAISRGCYILASDVGGLPEIVKSRERGELFEPENRAQLAGKIRECRGRWEGLSAGLRMTSESFQSEFGPEAGYRRMMEAYGASGLAERFPE